jgi:hypothetical protein
MTLISHFYLTLPPVGLLHGVPCAWRHLTDNARPSWSGLVQHGLKPEISTKIIQELRVKFP